MKIIAFTYQTDNVRLLHYHQDTGEWDCNFLNPVSGRWIANIPGKGYRAVFHEDATVSLTPSVNITLPGEEWHGWYTRGKYVK